MITALIDEKKITVALFNTLSKSEIAECGLPVKEFIQKKIKRIKRFINENSDAERLFNFTSEEGEEFYGEFVLDVDEKIFTINFYVTESVEDSDGHEEAIDHLVDSCQIYYEPLMCYTVTGTQTDVTEEVLGTLISNKK